MFSVPKIHYLAGWAYCFQVSSAGVPALRADALQLFRLGYLGLRERRPPLEQVAGHSQSLQQLTPPPPLSRVALEKGGGGEGIIV